MNRALILLFFFLGITFYSYGQDTGIFKVKYDALQKKITYIQNEMVQADSVEIINYKLEALDVYINKNKTDAETKRVIEIERTSLEAERVRILVAPHPERKRQ